MILSILQISPNEQFALYDCEQQEVLMTGPYEEVADFKHGIEQSEQITANANHLEGLKDKYINMLISGGHTKEEATLFLKKTMPKLY